MEQNAVRPIFLRVSIVKIDSSFYEVGFIWPFLVLVCDLEGQHSIFYKEILSKCLHES